MTGWEARTSGLRLVAYGRAYRVRPVGRAWVASEQGPRGVTREQACAGRSDAVALVEQWADAARAAFDAAHLALFGGDQTQERAESASLLWAPGGNMNARETLTKVAEAAPGWALDADSHARFATIAHLDGAVVELRQEREGEPWTCDAGRPGSMHRRQDHRPLVAVLLACAPGRDAAPEVRALFAVASRMMNADWSEPWKPEPLPAGRARVDAIIASLSPGPDLRENILAAEVQRLRGERDALRARVDAAHAEATGEWQRTREPHYAGERDALELVQEWLEADAEGGGA